MTNSSIYDCVCGVSNLRFAWRRVEESDGCAGVDGVTLARFGSRLEDELAALSRELAAETYAPLPLVSFSVPKRNGGKRPLCVPAVRDRVAQHGVIAEILPLFEAEFEACSFAYRRGRSAQQALAGIELLREQGYVWVVDADIAAFFENVSHDLLFERVAKLIPDVRVCRLIKQWVATRVYDGEKITTLEKGLPQGAPLSPLLANLYLDSFDEQMLAAEHKLVRFADDFLVLCKTKPKAEDALRLTAKLLNELRLNLAAEKTTVTNFADGFKYLGATFIRSLCLPPQSRRKNTSNQTAVLMPPPLPVLRPVAEASLRFGSSLALPLADALARLPDGRVPLCFKSDPAQAVADPVMTLAPSQSQPSAALTSDGERRIDREAAFSVSEASAVYDPLDDARGATETTAGMPPPTLHTLRTLYIHEHGAVLRCEDEHLRVLKDEVELLSLPAFKIDQIMIYGNTQVTTAAMKFCLRQGITIVLLSAQGRMAGTLEAPGNQNVLLQQKQFERLTDAEFLRATAAAIVAGKIANCRALLQRRQRSADDPRLSDAIEGLAEMKRRLTQASTLDEVRGYEGAASAHYYAGFKACIQPPFSFEGRTRRPPLDPINALLSFGYTLLFQNIYAIVRARGLSPFVGTLHSLRQGHPALCSDLLEELRAPVVDSLVTTVVNKRILSLSDFYTNDADRVGSSLGTRACFLTDEARRTFISHFEGRMNTVMLHPSAAIRTTWRGCIDLQVSAYIRVLRAEVPRYVPLEIR